MGTSPGPLLDSWGQAWPAPPDHQPISGYVIRMIPSAMWEVSTESMQYFFATEYGEFERFEA